MSENGRQPIGLRSAPEVDIQIELEGRLFQVRTMTRSVQAKLDIAEAALESATTSDEGAERIAQVIDAIVEPMNGQRKGAGALLTELWRADKVSMPQLIGLMQDIQQAALDVRPT